MDVILALKDNAVHRRAIEIRTISNDLGGEWDTEWLCEDMTSGESRKVVLRREALQFLSEGTFNSNECVMIEGQFLEHVGTKE